MMRTAEPTALPRLKRARPSGMTLIELIVVMGLLATVLAASAPSLSRFFAGRDIEEEARRFLALTRYARNEAISRCDRMTLWIRPETGEYGLRPDVVSENEKDPELEFRLADGLVFEVDAEDLTEDGEAWIVFWPDGSIDAESVEEVILEEPDGKTFEIVQAEFGLGYELSDEDDDE